MKKLLSLAALFIATTASALGIQIAPTGPAFGEQGLATLSFVPGFEDNITVPVGGIAATVNGVPSIVYLTTLPVGVSLPGGVEQFETLPITGPLFDFLTFTAPLVVDVETSAAAQLGVWALSGIDFEVVDNIGIGNAAAIAAGWIASSAGSGTTDMFAFTAFKKPYSELVFASPIPEPGSLVLLAFGAAAVLLAVRKRKA